MQQEDKINNGNNLNMKSSSAFILKKVSCEKCNSQKTRLEQWNENVEPQRILRKTLCKSVHVDSSPVKLHKKMETNRPDISKVIFKLILLNKLI